jgi:hypothetical protein
MASAAAVAAQQRLNDLPADAPESERNRATAELQSRRAAVSALEQRRNDTYVSALLGGPTPTQIIDTAQVPERPSANWPYVIIATFGALLLVLLVDALAVALLTLSGRHVHGAEDLGLARAPVVEMPRVAPVGGRENGGEHERHPRPGRRTFGV